jgi:prepilin peptidase CpaA
MVLFAKKWKHHSNQFRGILTEIFVIRDPEKLAQIATDRKPTMMLLPYGIPIAIGTVGYFIAMALTI